MTIETRKCKSGFLAVRVHYSVDPETWTNERIGSIRSAIPGWRWRKEYEIDFTARGGKKVYDNFDPAVHVRLPDVDVTTLPRYKVIDHGRRNPTVCLWWAEDPTTKTIYFYREYYQADATIAEHCLAIRRMERNRETRMTLIDPSTHRRLDNSYSTVADEYARHGVRTTPADNNIASGIEAITSALNASLARWSVENHTVHPIFADRLIPKQRVFVLAEERAICIHPSMANTIREIEQLSWDQTADDDNGKPLCERIAGTDDHCADCMRYAMLRHRARRHQVKGQNVRQI